MTLRNLARIGAVGVLTAGTLGLVATPALAAAVDLGIKAADFTLAAGAKAKAATVTVTNDGTTTPKDVTIAFDVSGLDATKVKPESDIEGCTQAGDVVTCALSDNDVPANDELTEADVPLQAVPGATGAAGTLTVTVKAPGDTNKANDSRTVKVALAAGNAAGGADLVVLADDVTEVIDGKDGPESTGEPVPPGAVGVLFTSIINRGDLTADGITVKVELPKQTTIAEPVDGCVQAANKRSLTCTLREETVPPFSKRPSPDKLEGFVSQGFIAVRVDADAKGPVSLKGGVVTAAPIAEKPFVPGQIGSTEDAVQLTPEEVAELDAGKGDDTDAFAVLVAGADAGDNGEADNGGGGTGGGDDDGGLPLTGPAGLAIGGTGLAVLLAGMVLFFTARRRRVVLVTPGDEK